MRARLIIAALVCAVGLDIALATMAVRHTRGPAPDTAAASSGEPGAGMTLERVDPSPSESPTPAQAPSATARPLTLSVSGEGTILAASRGDCADDVAPVVLVSSGADAVSERSVEGLSQVLDVDSSSTNGLRITGLDADCKLTTFTSPQGDAWESSPGGSGVWHLPVDPERQAVFAPSGEPETPCVPVSVSGIDASVGRVLCDTGRLIGTSSAGTDWITLGTLDGAADVEYLTPARAVAVAKQDDCRAAVFETFDGGTEWTRRACLRAGDARAVSATDGAWAVQAGKRLLVSSDDGATWTRVSSQAQPPA